MMSQPLNELRVSRPTVIGVATYPPGATYGPRTLRDHEFVWMIEGDADYRWGDRTEPAPAGAIVLCRPGTQDFFRWDPSRRTRHGYFHFQILQAPAHWPPPDEWPLVRIMQEGDVLRPLFRHLLTWHRQGDPLLAELAVMQMLAAFITGQLTAGDVPRDVLPDPVERVLRFIHQTLDEDSSRPLDLRDLAAAAAVSPEHLCRLFKDSLKLSPAQTVRLARLDRAAVLLARSNFSIARIAELCGFASQFHFSRRFRDAYGRSPRQLRQELLAGRTPPTPRLSRIAPGI
jgi:AraC family transcriptional regulator